MDLLAVKRTRKVRVDQPIAAPRRNEANELPDESSKWPRPLRAVVITGTAAALWALVHFALHRP